MRRTLAVLFTLLALTFVVGCGTKTEKAVEEKAASTTQSAPKVKINLLRDSEALAKFQKDVTEKFGDDFKVFRSTFGGTVHVYSDKIRFDAVDPNNTKNVDRYTWTKDKGFANPEPVKIRAVGSGAAIDDYAEYQDSFKGVDFTKIVAFVEESESKANQQQLEGVKPLTSISVDYRKGKRIFSASLSGTRKEARAIGDASTGAVTDFTIK